MRPNLVAVFLSYFLYIVLTFSWVVFEDLLSLNIDRSLHNKLGFNFSSLFLPFIGGLIVGFTCSKFRATKKYLNVVYLGVLATLVEVVGATLLYLSPKLQRLMDQVNLYYLPDPDWVAWCVFLLLPFVFLVGAWIQYSYPSITKNA